MSADNYYLIRPYKALESGARRFAVTMCFASSEPPAIDISHDAIFLTLDAADSWASDQYSEYGVEIDSSCFNPEDWDPPEENNITTDDRIEALEEQVVQLREICSELLAQSLQAGRITVNRVRTLLGLPAIDIWDGREDLGPDADDLIHAAREDD
jgi:hypothetical protein